MRTLSFILIFTFHYLALNAITCTWNGTTGNWSDGTKWIGGIPGSDDDVFINSGTITLDITPTIHSLTFTNGIIAGTGDLNITEDFTWSRGSLGVDYTSTGTINVAGITTLNYLSYDINKKVLNCNGGLIYESGDININYAGTINVPSGQTFLVTLINGNIFSLNSGDGMFNLNGTLHKTGGGFFKIFVPLNNSSSWDIDNGALQLYKTGTHTGVFNLASNTILGFVAGTHNLNAATIAGAGDITIATIVNFNAGTTISYNPNLEFGNGNINDYVGLSWNNFTQTSIGTYTSNLNVTIAGNLTLDVNGIGAIDGTGNLNVAGNFNWVGGKIGTYYSSTGTVTVGGLTTLSSGFTKSINRKTLQCNGGLTYAAGDFSINYDATINVPTGQTFLVTSAGGTISQDGAGTININGTFHKTGGLYFNVYPTMNNITTFNIDNGALRYYNSGTHSGVFNLASGAILSFGGGLHNLNAATIAGAGDINIATNVNFNSGTIITSNPNLVFGGYGNINDYVGLSWNNFTQTSLGFYNSNLNVAVAGDLTISVNGNGGIDGTGNFNVAGDFSWEGGKIGTYYPSTGTVTIGGLTTLSSVFAKSVNRKTLQCNGGITYISGDFMISYDGTINVPSGQIFLVSINGGNISGDGVGTLNIDGTLHKTGGGILTISVGFNTTTTSIIENGNLQLNGGGSYAGNLNIASGSTMNLTAGSHAFTNCNFTGTGTINKSVGATISSFTGNNLSPGNSPGILNISGYPLNLSGNTYNVELAGYGGPGTPNGHDQIVVSGSTASIGGTLNISFLNGFEPVVNDYFVIMTCSGGCGGSFSTINHPGNNPSAFQIDVTTNPNEVRLILAQALPIELISFIAKPLSEMTAQLEWKTASEINNFGFFIEKSTDGLNFEDIGFIEGEALSNQMKTYHYQDESFIDDAYYRLRQVDINGKVNFSHLVFIWHKGKSDDNMQIYPNPASEGITIVLPKESHVTTNLVVQNTLGQVVRLINVKPGSVKLDMDISQLDSGIYFIKDKEKNGVAIRFVKQ